MNKRNVTITIMVIATALTLGACGSDGSDTSTSASEATATGEEPGKDGPVDGVRRLWIKPDLLDCVGEAPQKCMQVAEAEDGDYLLFYDQILGFNFEEGTGYVVDVRVEEVLDPPADASLLKYTLAEVISTN